MDCYDTSGVRIELGSNCKFRVLDETHRGTVVAVGVTSYSDPDGGDPTIQWEVLVQDSKSSESMRKWVPVANVEIEK
jgi:hypothetical protein